jgi:hypothetical protein
MLFAPKPREGPRLGELAVQTSSYGTPIPKLFGTMRVAGTVIWSTDLIERRSTSGGGKGRPKQVDYSYSASFAVALSARRVSEVRRIWADGKLLRGAGGDFKVQTRFRLHDGDEDQAVDPLIAAAEGASAPAFRGTAYAMFEELELAEFGNRIPSLTFEVVAEAGPVEIGAIAAELAPGLRAGGATPAFGGFVASGGSVRGAMEDAAELTGVMLIDDGAALEVRAPGGAAVALPRARESKRRELMRRPAGAVPGEVTLSYHDAGRDYQAGLQRAVAPGAAGAQAERRALAAVLSADGAKALAERRLDAVWAQRLSATVDCGWGGGGAAAAKAADAGERERALAGAALDARRHAGEARAGARGGAGGGRERGEPGAADEPAGLGAWAHNGASLRPADPGDWRRRAAAGGAGGRERSGVADGRAVGELRRRGQLARHRPGGGAGGAGPGGNDAAGRRVGLVRPDVVRGRRAAS